MESLKRELVFIDAENHKVRADVEITHRNGYAEFAMSGQFLGGYGQVIDDYVPANEAQRELQAAHAQYHLKNVENIGGFRENIERIIKDIELAEKRRAEGKEPLSGDDAVLDDMEQEGIDANMLDAVKAYRYIIGSDDLKDFLEAYQGEWSSDEDFAQSMADDIGAINKDASWPNNCIDWEQAARELMYDYSEHEGYYFRNI